jgi:hypothetical protein
MKLCTRQEILQINKVFTYHLIQVQDAKQKPKENEYKIGDKVILDDSNKSVTLTQVLVDKLNKESIEDYNANKDSNPFTNEFKWIGWTTMISAKKSVSDYLTDLGTTIEKLRIYTKNNSLIILGDWSTPWLYQENDYKPVKDSLDFLKSIVAPDFNGGFLLHGQDLVDFIPRLFWLIRCNMSLPQFMMTFENLKTIITICKHGVIHFESYDTNELSMIVDFFKQLDFVEIDNCSDPIKFDNFDGRQIKLSS